VRSTSRSRRERKTHSQPAYPNSRVALDLKPLIDRAIKLGWIRRPTAPKLKTDSYLRRETRAHWHARGLNSSGRPRRNTRHPELTGLNRKTYHREYMKLWRKKKFTFHASRFTHTPQNSLTLKLSTSLTLR